MRKKTQRTYIGGQAVIQGVMMRSKSGMATVVRDDNGEMQTGGKAHHAARKAEEVAAVSLCAGGGELCLLPRARHELPSAQLGSCRRRRRRAVQVHQVDGRTLEDLRRRDRDHHLHRARRRARRRAVSVPAQLFCRTHLGRGARASAGAGSIWYNLIEGGFRFVIFLLYILFTLLFASLRETYRYHGAEHKTINCYEYGDELTVENVKKASRLHDRCGTTFIFLVLVISIFVFALANWAARAHGHDGHRLAGFSHLPARQDRAPARRGGDLL